MAIMRAEIKSGGGGDWLGIKTGKIVNITDDSNKWSWADVYLNVEFEVEGSQYPRVMKIAGSFDKEADGKIKDCTLLKRITFFLDALGEQGGVNQDGKWETEEGQPISNICDHLNKYCGVNLTIFIFKELSKNGQAYTRVHNKVLPVSAGSEKELESYIEFLRSKGFLKEAPEDMSKPANNVVMNGTDSENFDASGISVENL